MRARRRVRWYLFLHRLLQARSVRLLPAWVSVTYQDPQPTHLPDANRTLGTTGRALAGWSGGMGVDLVGCVSGIGVWGQCPKRR